MSRQNELLGHRCRDKITGAVGVCVERIVWAFGCDKYVLRTAFCPEKEIKQVNIVCDDKSLEILDTVVEIDPSRDEFGNQNTFFGHICRDKVTGFQGICTGRITALYSSDMYCLDPRAKKKVIQRKSEWFDEGRIEVIGEGIKIDDITLDKPGGVDSYPSREAEMAALMCDQL